jgi:hypothetical protein
MPLVREATLCHLMAAKNLSKSLTSMSVEAEQQQ